MSNVVARTRPLRVITNSEIASRSCPRLHELRYILRLSPAAYGPAPSARGTLFHRLLQEDVAPGDDAARSIVDPWIEERLQRFDRSDRPIEDDDDAITAAEDVAEVAARTLRILGRYRAQWREEDEERFETIAREQQVARAILHDDGRPYIDVIDGKRRRWVYGGAIDRVVRDRVTGAVWLVETKTTKERDLEEFARKLSHDAQTRGYAWALRKPDTSLEITDPIVVSGVLYDVIRDKEPTVPEPLVKCGACGHPRSKHDEHAGCSGSQKCVCMRWVAGAMSVRADIDTTWDVFRDAVVAAGLDPGDYEDMRRQLHGRESQFFRRVAYPFTAEEIGRFGSYALAWADEMRAAERSRRSGRHAAPNPSVCLSRAPRRCPGSFESACLIGDEDLSALDGFVERTVRHVELRGVLAEELAQTPIADRRARDEQAARSLLDMGSPSSGPKPHEYDEDALPFP